MQERSLNQGFRDNVGSINPALLHEFKGNEVKVGFSGFFILPLTHPIVAPGFIRCPAGIAITEQRLWLAHLPFLEDGDEKRLWRSWYRHETSPPMYSFAFGLDTIRLMALADAMKRRTGSRKVDISAAISEKQDLYDLEIEQSENTITVRFRERASLGNFLLKGAQI